MNEVEERVLEVNPEEVVAKLEALGAKKVGDWFQRRYIYDFMPKRENEWIRLRSNGKETTLTYKNTEAKSTNGTRELEVVVSGFEETNELLRIMGYVPRAYQENKRIRYYLDHMEIDIDTWPLIPTYVEIEGGSEEDINKVKELLGITTEKTTKANTQQLYLEEYGIDMNQIEELKFEEEDNQEVIKL